MKDDRTADELYSDWLIAVNKCAQMGWKCITGYLFQSPVNGSIHDLSATDLNKLHLL